MQPSTSNDDPRIRVVGIDLVRAEGPIALAGQARRVAGWDEADAVLRDWAATAPAAGGYDKCDFTISFEDGVLYRGRYDLVNASLEIPDLAAHVRGTALIHSGLGKPSFMDQEQFDALQAMIRPEVKQAYVELVSKYSIPGLAASGPGVDAGAALEARAGVPAASDAAAPEPIVYEMSVPIKLWYEFSDDAAREADEDPAYEQLGHSQIVADLRRMVHETEGQGLAKNLRPFDDAISMDRIDVHVDNPEHVTFHGYAPRELSAPELGELRDAIADQLSDVWGEGFEQQQIWDGAVSKQVFHAGDEDEVQLDYTWTGGATFSWKEVYEPERVARDRLRPDPRKEDAEAQKARPRRGLR